MVATHRLDQVVPPPVISPDAPPDQQVPTNPELQLPDWGRAVLAWPFDVSVENGHRFTTDNMTREFNELDQVLKIEGSDPIDQNNLAATFAEGESSTVSRDASGNIEIQVIGAGSFKAATRRHLFATIYPTYKWMGEGLGDKDQAASFLDQMNILFRGVPEYELATYLDASEGIDIPKIVSQWRDQKKLWLITDVPVGISLTQLPGKDLAVDFYSAIPFGTLYHVEQRYPFIQQKLQRNYPSLQFQFQKANQLPPDKRMAAINKATADFQAREDRDSAKFRAENSQLTLTPDPSDLLSDGDGAISPTSPILDYNLRKLKSLEGKLLESRFVGSKDWNPSEYEMLLRKHVTMEPDAYFALADFLRTQGKDDEAAAMDRKGAAEAYDQVGMSDSVLNLVDYDLNHGLKDEALAISQKASDLGSQMGMGTYSYVLDRLGRLDEAESVAKEIQADYGDDSWLLTVHIANPDHFPEEYALAKNNAFPDGLVRVGLAFFSGKPQTGCQIGGLSSRLEEAHLEVGDVIVALDGYKVDSERQYGFVQHLTNDSHMDFIIWREGRYIEVKAYLTARRFFAPINDYTGN
jgi:tetratricopeptide (TPR) repeat protein